MSYRPQLTIPWGDFQLNVHSQLQSPLFFVPAEVRLIIYSYTITDYEVRHWDLQRVPATCSCFAVQRRTHIGLLGTCKRILQETWFMPFEAAEHRVCNSHTPRIPEGFGYPEILLQCARHEGMHIPQIQNMRYLLRNIDGFEILQKVLLSVRRFEPKCVTLEVSYFATVLTDRFQRHVRICNEWADELVFPESVTTVITETYGSKSNMEGIVSLVVGKWRFRRADGAVFKVDKIEKFAREWDTLARRDYDRCSVYALVWFTQMVTWVPVMCEDAGLKDSQKSGSSSSPPRLLA